MRKLRVGLAGLVLMGIVGFMLPASGAPLATIPFGQQLVSTSSAPKNFPLPLHVTVGTLRPFAGPAIQGATFDPISVGIGPVSVQIFSADQVKSIVSDAFSNVSDDTVLALKVNSLTSTSADFPVTSDCVGKDGTVDTFCTVTMHFAPTSEGAKSGGVNATVDITSGLTQIRDALQSAVSKQGITGTIIALVMPLLTGQVNSLITDDLTKALLTPALGMTGNAVKAPFASIDAFTIRQHHDFAGRAPTSGELTSWANQFNVGLSLEQLIDNLRRGAYYDGAAGPLIRLYSAYYLRTPDAGGLTYWLNRLHTGTDLPWISDYFAHSPEFRAKYGTSLSPTGFVTLVYANVLNRAPDAGGLAFWVGKMTNEHKTRGWVMLGFSEAKEYRVQTQPTVDTTEVFYGMLGRVPTSGELGTWTPQLGAGTPVTTLIHSIMMSAEYATRLATP